MIESVEDIVADEKDTESLVFMGVRIPSALDRRIEYQVFRLNCTKQAFVTAAILKYLEETE